MNSGLVVIRQDTHEARKKELMNKLADPYRGVDHPTTPQHRSHLRSLRSVLVEYLDTLRPSRKEAPNGR